MVWYSHLFKNFPQVVVIHTKILARVKIQGQQGGKPGAAPAGGTQGLESVNSHLLCICRIEITSYFIRDSHFSTYYLFRSWIHLIMHLRYAEIQ